MCQLDLFTIKGIVSHEIFALTDTVDRWSPKGGLVLNFLDAQPLLHDDTQISCGLCKAHSDSSCLSVHFSELACSALFLFADLFILNCKTF